MKFVHLGRSALLAASLVLAPVHAQAPPDLRVAVVIGNAAYEGAPLANPVHDAQAVAAAFRRMGFQVIEAEDADRSRMQAAIVEGSKLLEPRGGVGVFYYAGHGLQLDWHNYMLPVDARLRTAADVERQAVDVQAVLDAFKATGNRVSVVILDACRDNPFGPTASAKGLAAMDAPTRTLLAYATAPGSVADDGQQGASNGLYTQYLIEEIERPDATIEDVFKRVRSRVLEQSQGKQIPWESTSLEDEFRFASADARTNRADQRRSGSATKSAGTTSSRYAVGDTFEYTQRDFYGKELKPWHIVVTEAKDDVVLNGGKIVWDAAGNLITDGSGKRTPPKIFVPPDLAVGKSWRSTYEIASAEGKSSLYWDFKVVGSESLVVPAGRFDTLRIEGTSEVSTGTKQVETYWLDVATLLMVKDIYVSRQGGNVTGFHDRQLSLAQRVPR